MARLFGDKLRSLRRQHKLTQVDLAERLRLASQGYIADLEAGDEVPSLDLVVRVARVFDVSTDYLLRDTRAVEELVASTINAGPIEDARPGVLGANLRALRLQRRLSQTDLAHQLGLARRGYISNLETGRKAPSLDLVVQIADLFGVTTDDLLHDTLPTEVEGSKVED
jgi:transcriptional regulator with XRE-family HTH domain